MCGLSQITLPGRAKVLALCYFEGSLFPCLNFQKSKP
jgi:hypothetical protein